jgi:hypothetical protein
MLFFTKEILKVHEGQSADFLQFRIVFWGDRTFKGSGRKVGAMQTFLIVLLIWITPSFLFVGWRLWMSRPLPEVHYRRRWQYSHALVGSAKRQTVHFHEMNVTR